MTQLQWPKELPETLRLEGLSIQKKTNVIRTKMDTGPQKVRLRYTAATKEIAGTILIDEKKRLILEQWYKTVLANGVLRFVMKDSQTGQPGEFRFMEDYTEKNVDGLWEIGIRLEKMNA